MNGETTPAVSANASFPIQSFRNQCTRVEPAMTDASLTLGPADLAPRARIREAALRLYAEHGLRSTSIRMVAEEAGMSPGAVMHHFKSKDELAEAVQHAVIAKIRQVVSEVGLEALPHVAARERRQAFDQLVTDNPSIAGYLRRVILEGGPAGVALFAEGFDLVRSEMQALVEAQIARPLPDPEVGLVLYRGGSPGPYRLRPAGRADVRAVAIGSRGARAIQGCGGRPADRPGVRGGTSRRGRPRRDAWPAGHLTLLSPLRLASRPPPPAVGIATEDVASAADVAGDRRLRVAACHGSPAVLYGCRRHPK